MGDGTKELETALGAAFPPEVVEREMIDEPSANWSVYDDYGDLQALEGRSWADVPASVLSRHPTLPVYAGDRLFHAMVPAYLRHVLREEHRLDELPFQLAHQLTRIDDPDYHPKFDRRAALFTRAQCAAVRDVLGYLSARPAIDEPMARAVSTWEHLWEALHEE